MLKPLNEVKIGIIGLGYVGLPLAVEFAKKFPVIGFDIDKKRINDLKFGKDFTLEVEDEFFQAFINKAAPQIGEKGLF